MKKKRKREHRNYEGVTDHPMAALKAATPELQRRAMDGMSVGALLRFDADFETWAHKNQLPPTSEGWRIWLMLAGRGFGKTRAGAEWINALASRKPAGKVPPASLNASRF